MPENKILVIRGGAIGDFILTVPVLMALRKHFPGTRLEVLGYPNAAKLALAAGWVDGVRSIEAGPLAGFFALDGTLNVELKNYFSTFAIILSYLYDPDGVFRGNIARCSGAQFIQGVHRPDDAEGLHATRVFLKALERLAVFDADSIPRLPLKRESPRRTVPRLALHPGSGSEHKNWPEKRWVELMQHCVASTAWDFLVVGGEAEWERVDQLKQLIPASRVTLARGLPLVELAGLLSDCDGFVGHDSGITHLAAAVGIPSLALWGHTADAVWRPQGAHVRVLRHELGIWRLSVEMVFNQIKEMIEKKQA